MSYQNSHQNIQKFVANYGALDRSYAFIPYVQTISRQNSWIDIDSNSFLNAPGKKRKIDVTYFPVRCGDVGECSTNPCTMEGTVVEPTQRQYDITECIASIVYRLNKEDVRLIDANTGEWGFSGLARQIINSALPDMRRRIAIAFATKLTGMAGVHADGSATKLVATTDISNGVVNPIGRFMIEKEYMDAGMNAPYIIGGDEVFYNKAMVGIGGMNNSGQNIGALNTNNMWYDDGILGTVLGDTDNGGYILAVDPRVVKFVTYSANAGIFSTSFSSIEDLPRMRAQQNMIASMIEGSFTDPVTGLTFDFYANYDCDHWNFQIKLHWDILLMPEVACNVQGYNGITLWRTCPPVLVTCPSGSPVPSPAAETEFSWTPTLADIPMISNITLGGKTYNFNTPEAIATLADLAAALNEAMGVSGMFTVDSTDIVYDGYVALEGEINTGIDPVTVTFA